jgi:hypothetical protein
LLALGVDGAAGGYRAGAATWIHPGLEERAGHSRRHRFHQVLGPGGVRVIGQRGLPLNLGARGQAGLSDLDQLGAAGLGQAEPLERAKQHRELVDAELRMPVQFLLARSAAAGLEVDHYRSLLIIRLEPVDATGDLHLADPDLEGLLDRDQLARVGGVPVQELAHHLLGQRALLTAVPDTSEIQMVPDFVDPISHSSF